MYTINSFCSHRLLANKKIYGFAKKFLSNNIIYKISIENIQNISSNNTKKYYALPLESKLNFNQATYKLKSCSKRFYSQNHYELQGVEKHFTRLGIEKNFSKEEVKNSFVKLTKLYHPDINNEESAKKNFQDIKNSYDILLSYFDDQENNKIRFIEKSHYKEIDTIISNIFNKRLNNSKINSNKKARKGDGTLTKSKEEEIIHERKIKLFQQINDTLNTNYNNYNSIDIYDLEKLKKNYKKLRMKLKRAEAAAILLDNKIQSKHEFSNLLNKKKSDDPCVFSKLNKKEKFEDKADNHHEGLTNYVLIKKMKILFRRMYEIVIKIIVVYCLCYFISLIYSKKISYFIGFYLVFMIITS